MTATTCTPGAPRHVGAHAPSDEDRDAAVERRAQGAIARRRAVLVGLTVLAVLAAFAGLTLGAVRIPLGDTLRVLLATIHLADASGVAPRHEAVLTTIRLPRIALGLLVGGALAMAGAALQGLFRNPLADPGLIGVSSGAALGAVTTIVLAAALPPALSGVLGMALLPTAAFAGGLLATVLVYRLATRDGVTDTSTLLLAGIAINAIAGALIGLLIFLADDAQLRTTTLWLLGSLGGATQEVLLWVALPTVVGLALLRRETMALNAFLLGEREAGHIGIDVRGVRRRIVALSALLVGAAVAFTGMIGFVGLVVPHLLRLAFGPDHRLVLPGSALLGGALLVLADLGARTIAAPAELPIGVLTSLVGGPFFLILLLQRRRTP